MLHRFLFISLLFLNVLSLLCCIFTGSVHIPASDVWGALTHDHNVSDGIRFIVMESRLPAAITACLTGGALGVCGLLLQSYFRNPLAGPSILGITNGANLMVALVTLGGWGTVALTSQGSVLVLAALAGSFGILTLLLAIGRMVRNSLTLLIVGMMLSYLTSAIITLLGYHATATGVQGLMLWGMGSFNGVSSEMLPWYALFIIASLLASALLIKPLNGWMQGELYAQSIGISVRRTRWLLLIVSGILAAITTAFTGPIAFVGISMPHVARLLLHTDDHRRLLPASLLLGSLCCTLCLTISTLPDGGSVLPINALTPIFGVPVILYVVIPQKAA